MPEPGKLDIFPEEEYGDEESEPEPEENPDEELDIE